MKRICCILTGLTILLSNITVMADRNKDRFKAEQSAVGEQAVTVTDKIPTLPEELQKELSGYVVIKTDNKVYYENGIGKEIDVAAFSKEGIIYLPAAVIAESFGEKAIWIEETRSVKIGNVIVHPSDISKIVSGRTMIKAENLAEYLGVSVVYISSDTVILGKNTMSEELIEKVTSRLRDKFYVVNDTTVSGDGSIDKPFGGIKAAVEGIREYTKGGMSQNITVYLRGGLYAHREEITFLPEDSGKNGYFITYKSYPGEVAEIVGAEEINGWTEYKDGIYTAKINPPAGVNMLFENDSFGRKARYPNLGNGEFRDYYLKSAGYNKENSKQFYFNSGDLPYIDNTTGLQVGLFGGGEEGIFNWDMHYFDAVIDERRKTLTMSTVPRYVMGKGSRYFIQGCLELLDCEGEYWYDSANKTIYYKPYNDDINSQVITYGTVLSPIALRGTDENRVKNIIFEDLKIGKSNIRDQIGEGMHEANIFLNADNCAIKNSEILHTGGDAIRLQNCNECEISGNYFHDLGSNGIKLQFSNYDGEIKYRGNIITNNYIYNVGMVKRDSNGIYLFHADENTVTHNKIEKVPRNGLSIYTGNISRSKIGKTIRGTLVTAENQFEYVNARGNYIAYNDISNCMEDSQDGGPIYSWGAGIGNVFENNHIHDSNIHFSIGYGIYCDDQTLFATYRKNIIDNLQKEGAGKLNATMITKSVGHNVTNNFFLNNPAAAKGAYSTETKLTDQHDNIQYTRNITMNSSDQLHGQWAWHDDRFKVCDYNFYYNDSGRYLIYNNIKAKNLDEWKRIQTNYGLMDQHSISGENPDFVDYENRDYRLRYDTSAYSLGIEDIDEKNIGVKADFKFADREGELYKLYLETESDGLSANVRLKSGKQTKILTSARTTEGFFANLENAQISYSSSDENVATVDNNGVITAKNTGIAEMMVKASKNGKTVSSVLYVLVNDGFEGVQVNAVTGVLDIGTETELVSVAKSSMGYYIPVEEFTYSSSNENIATVDKSGKVTAVGKGEAIITVTASYNGVSKSNQAKIKVLDGVLDTVTVKMDKVDAIIVGEKLQVSFDAAMTRNAPVDLSAIKATYESGDDSVVTIDENGMLTAVGEGRTSVTVTLEKDGFRKGGAIQIAVFEKYSGTLGEGFKEVNFGTSYGYADFIDDKIKIRATGKDFWGAADDGYYLYKEIESANPSIEMTVESLYNTHANAAVGVTLRESANADSKNVTLRMTPSKSLIMLWRLENGGSCGYFTIANNDLPVKIKLEKVGKTVNAYTYKNNKWQLEHSVEIDMRSKLTAGVPVFAQSPDCLSTEAVISGLVINE